LPSGKEMEIATGHHPENKRERHIGALLENPRG
jgi:hypothetical protein